MEQNNSGLNFSEETSKNIDGKLIKKFLINGKQVKEDTYYKLINSEMYDKIPLQERLTQGDNMGKKKDNKNNNENINNNYINYNSPDYNCQCDECKAIREMVKNIKEMSDEDAFDYLNAVLDKNAEISGYQSQQALLEQFGQSMYKISAQIDNKLDEIDNGYDDCDNEDDED